MCRDVEYARPHGPGPAHDAAPGAPGERARDPGPARFPGAGHPPGDRGARSDDRAVRESTGSAPGPRSDRARRDRAMAAVRDSARRRGRGRTADLRTLGQGAHDRGPGPRSRADPGVPPRSLGEPARGLGRGALRAGDADVADLHDAVAAARDAVAGTPPGDRERGVREFLLGRALYDQAKETGGLDDAASQVLDEILEHLRAATSPMSPDAPVHPDWRVALAEAYVVGLARDPDPEFRDAAIEALRDAEPLLAPSDPRRAPLLAALAMQLHLRDRPGDLEEAAKRLEDGHTAFPDGTPGRSQLAVIAAKVLTDLSHRAGSPEHLAGAVAAAVDATSGPDGRATPEALIAEGSARRLRYEREGRPEDLDRALDLLSEGVARTTEGADRASPLAILAVARRMRYARTGDLRDLDDAVDEARAAARLTSANDEGRPEVLGSLATVLFTR